MWHRAAWWHGVRRASSLPYWRMRWFDHHGNVVGSLGDQNSYTEVALSPDDTRVATSQGYPVRNVWLFDVRTGTGSRVSRYQAAKDIPAGRPMAKCCIT